MKWFAKLFSEWLVKNEIVEKNNRELYEYGFWQGSVLLFNLLTIALVGIILEMLWQSVIFTIAYGSLRPLAGGFHARTQSKCYIYSVLMLIITLKLLCWNQWDIPSCMIVLITSDIIIFKLAPVEDENKPLDDLEVAVYQHRSRIVCGTLTIISLFFLLINRIEISNCIMMSVMVVAVMLVLGKVRNRYITSPHSSKTSIL